MDYAAIQDEEEQRLAREIQEERKLRSSIQWAIEDLERAIVPLEEQLRTLDLSEEPEGNEWAVRYRTQRDLNELLEKQYDWLRSEYERKKELLSEGLTLDARNLDLGRFTEHDLARLQGELERERNHMYGLLRDAEWKLDKRSQEVFHLTDLRKAYRSQIQQLDWKLQKLRSSTSIQDLASLTAATPTPDPASVRTKHQHRLSRSQSPSRVSRRSDFTVDGDDEPGYNGGDTKPDLAETKKHHRSKRNQNHEASSGAARRGKSTGSRTLPTLKNKPKKQDTKDSGSSDTK